MPKPTTFAANYAASLQEKLGKKHAEKFPTLAPIHFKVEAGNVYDKLIEYREGGGGSVHAFVVRATGDLVKAGGWKAPAKSKTHPSGLAVRYNLATPEGFLEALGAADQYGGYLYAK